VVWEGKLYVVGGFGEYDVHGDGDVLKSGTVYDFATKEWTVLPAAMAQPRFGHSAAVHKGVIYVMGGMGPVAGHDAEVVLSSIESYDIRAGVWCAVRSFFPYDVSSGRIHIHASVSDGGYCWVSCVFCFDDACVMRAYKLS
jgi:hypothetical protein